MQLIQILFLVSFTLIWLTDSPPKVGIAIFFTVAFGLAWLGVVIHQDLNGPYERK